MCIICAKDAIFLLFGSSCAQDVLCIVHRVARAVDNAMVAGSLRDWPFAVRPEGVVRRELFHVYKPTKKKKMKEVLVVLHQDHVIFAQLKPKTSWRDMAACEFVDSLDVSQEILGGGGGGGGGGGERRVDER